MVESMARELSRMGKRGIGGGSFLKDEQVTNN